MSDGSVERPDPEPSAAFIAEQLEVERTSKSSLEQRALGVLASSGVIGSLAGVAVRGSDLPCASRTLLVVALIGFAAAALLAVSVAHPAHYREALHRDLRGLLEGDEWNATHAENLHRVSEARLDLRDAFERINTAKARRLARSHEVLAGGIVFLLAAVVVALVLD